MMKVHKSAVVDKKADLANDVVVGPNCVIDEGVTIDSGTVLDANVVIGKNVQIGKNNSLYANCAIGRNPQLLGMDEKSKIGGLVIGDNNIIREQVTIHPSIYPSRLTRIGNENLLMVGVHIGHDCQLEDKIVLSNYTQISGHCRLENGVWLSGVVAVHQFVTIGKWCYAAGFAGINHDVPPFVIVSGHYPPIVRAVNKRGMYRAGLNPQQQENIMTGFKRLYRTPGPLLSNAKALAAQDGLDENVRAMVDAIIKSSKHRFGRYLELSREHRTYNR
jgi:UDP-N-acetylglucosamine acyltransferase